MTVVSTLVGAALALFGPEALPTDVTAIRVLVALAALELPTVSLPAADPLNFYFGDETYR